MNDEFKTVNFIDTLNRVVLVLSMLLAIVLIFLESGSSYNPIYPFRYFGIILVPTSIVNYFILKLIINWARDTIHIKLYNKELVDYNKDIKNILVRQTKFIEANLKKEVIVKTESVKEK